MLGSLIAPIIQYGVMAALVVGAVWFIGRFFVNRHLRKEAERHAKIRDKQAENARDKPTTSADTAERLRDESF